jgi:hypothetical protein
MRVNNAQPVNATDAPRACQTRAGGSIRGVNNRRFVHLEMRAGHDVACVREERALPYQSQDTLPTPEKGSGSLIGRTPEKRGSGSLFAS